MKGLKFAVLALAITSLAQAGILDTLKGYTDKGKEYYTKGKDLYQQHEGTIKGVAAQAPALYDRYGNKLAPVIGQKGTGLLGQGAGAIGSWAQPAPRAL